ncbi:MAG: hypothetical protein HY319_31360 [Armatimonadetes bacterium]|nr:hypothetical protein [Armatimonadota bacterium]
MSDPDNLEELLAAARVAGQFESAGQFTLDPGRAAELLSRYQLADPEAFILKLVQWAVASKARSICIVQDDRYRLVMRRLGGLIREHLPA